MTQNTNAGPEGEGAPWAQQAPVGSPSEPTDAPAPAAPTAPAATAAPAAPMAPAAAAPMAPPAADPSTALHGGGSAHAAPRREWPFSPEARQSWAQPGARPEPEYAGAPAPGYGAAQGYGHTAPAATLAPPAPPAPQPPYAGSFGHTPYAGPDAAPAYPTLPLGYDAAPPGAQPPAGPLGDRGRRRGPGWLGVMGVSLATAVLASGITAGLTRDGDSSPTATVTQRAQSAPVVPGSSSTSPDWQTVAKAVAPSVVAVQVTTEQGGGQGSGVVYDTKGNIVTNNHVVADATKVVVVLSDGREFDATVVGTDPSTDLAVIRITDPPKDLTTATFGDSESVTVGAAVMAIGNPLGLSDTATTGIVSAINRPVTAGRESGGGSGSVTNAIQTDASINPGNSGGALLDSQGRVIGITSSIATLGAGSVFPGQSSQSGSIGLGFAIPSNEAKSVADQIIATNGKTVEHAWLGVNLKEGTVTVDGARRKAALLGEVTNGSPASKAGLKANDAVIAMNGESIAGADSLVAQVREKRTNDTVTLTIVRDGKAQDVTVTLGVRPASLG